MGIGLKNISEGDIVKVKLENKVVKGKVILFDDTNIMLDASSKYTASIINIYLEDVKSIKKILK